jgi:hypothetical protein
MRWLRVNARFGGRLALFALALQFVLSFGHIHREDIYGPAHGAAGAKQIAATTVDETAANPAENSTKHSDDYCEICATISLLSNSFVAAPPPLPLPAAFHTVEHTDTVVTIVVATHRTPFQSRAPPTA